MKKDTLLTDAVNVGYANQGPKQWPVFGDTAHLDRTKYVSASEAASCARKLWYDKNTATHGGKPALQAGWTGHAERGHTAEAWVIEQFKRANHFKIMCCGDDQRSFVHGNMSGTPDGVVLHSDGTADVIDIKSFDPRKNAKNFPDPKHVAQVKINCYLVGKNTDLTVRRGRLLYIDAANYANMYEFVFPAASVEEYIEKANTITSVGSAEELRPEGMYDGSCRFCAHTQTCAAAIEYERAQLEDQKQRLSVSNGFFG